MINNRTDASKTDINLLNLRTRMLRDLLGGEWQMSHYSCTITIFTMTAKFSSGHWLLFIVNNRTDTWIYNLCDNDAILLASDWSFSHFCLAFFSWFDLILTPPPFCYCKKQIDVSFPCVCPVIDHEFCHNIVTVVCGSTRLSPRGSTATLTMLWRNSWSITGQTHRKLTSIC